MGGVIPLLLALFCLQGNAQTTERWKGEKLEKLKTTTELKDKKGATTGKIDVLGDEFYLYNVGTGRFVTCDGEWGEQARLDYRDFGAAMTLGFSTAIDTYYPGTSTLCPNLIFTGMEGIAKGENKDDHPYCLGINYPKVTTQGDYTWTNPGNNTYGPYFKAHPEEGFSGSNDWYRRGLTFIRVEDASDTTTYTYRIREEICPVKDKDNTKYCYWGAHQGVNSETGMEDQLDNNIMTFSEVKTADASYGYPVTSKYYQWRLVTKKEMEKVVLEENAENYGGANANVSYLVDDPFFDRNRTDEFNTWTVNSTAASVANPTYVDINKTDKDYKDYTKTHVYTCRYPWTGSESAISVSNRLVSTFKNKADNGGYGDLNRCINYVSIALDAPWDAAILRKIQSETKANGKYSYALLEGKGTAERTIDVPKAGYYRISCRGIASQHDAKLFAKGYNSITEKAKFEREDAAYGKDNFTKVINWPDRSAMYRYTALNATIWNKDGYKWTQWSDSAQTAVDVFSYKHYAKRYELKYINGDGLIGIGETLYKNANNKYDVSVIVYVGDDKKLTYGVEKEQATQSDPIKREWLHNPRTLSGTSWDWGTSSDDIQILRTDNFYYDTDVAAFDNFQIVYLGQDMPVLLNEGEESDTYIYDVQKNTDGKFRNNKNLTTYLKRTFSKDNWNTLVLPVNMTADQIFDSFGEGTKIAQLEGVGANGHSDRCISFKTKQLTTQDGNVSGNVVESGEFYLIKPTKQPAATYDVQPVYTDAQGNLTQGDRVTCTPCYVIGRHNYTSISSPNHTYSVANPKDADDKIIVNGTYCSVDDSQGPQPGDYVFSGGDLWHIDGKMASKGFRGWLSTGKKNDGGDGAKELTFGFDLDNVITFVDGISVKPATQTTNIYTVGGQLVRRNTTSTDGLQKGIYIVNGKKVVVK